MIRSGYLRRQHGLKDGEMNCVLFVYMYMDTAKRKWKQKLFVFMYYIIHKYVNIYIYLTAFKERSIILYIRQPANRGNDSLYLIFSATASFSK